jgi:Protein of unknown function (DUF2510)
MMGWPLFRRGIAVLSVGVVITVVTFLIVRPSGGFYVICFVPVVYGLTDTVRGLASVKTAQRLAALKRPISERKPWLFAAAPFAANPDGRPDAAEPGWHRDPMNSSRQRWWDGQTWTEDTRATRARA